MVWIILLIIAVITVFLYSCLIVAKQSDRAMKKIFEDKK